MKHFLFFFILLGPLLIYSCNNKEQEDILTIKNREIQTLIDNLKTNETFMISEIGYKFVFDQLEIVVSDSTKDLFQFGENKFFVSRLYNKYFIVDADYDYDPDIEQTFYFILTKKIIKDSVYGEINVLEVEKKQNQN